MYYRDQLHRRLRFEDSPQRIISLVPSQTELLHYLGLEEKVIGITKFCVHPGYWQHSKTIIGGTKKLMLDRIAELSPDLIIGNKEENDKAQIETLMEKYPVWMSDIKTLDDAFHMIRELGLLLNRKTKADELIKSIKQEFNLLRKEIKKIPTKKVAYLIWRKPYMVVGQETFINDLLKRAGFQNVFENQDRYPTIEAQELLSARPQIILLSSEPFPFRQKHITELQELCPKAVIRLVDGELFSWYGSRLLQAAPYFLNLQRSL